MRSITGRLGAVMIVAVLLAAGLTTSAYGYSQVIYNGFTSSYSGERAPNRHSLTKADADRTGGNDQACVNALNDSDGTWAGSTYCSGDYTAHSYCGCRLRWGYNFDGGQWTNSNGVNYGVYVTGIQYY